MDLEASGSIATLTIPERLSWDALDALGEQLETAITSSVVRALLLVPSGDDFCLGFPTSAPAAIGAGEALAASRAGQAVLDRLESCGKPSLAALSGKVVGAGCELALACSLRVLSTAGSLRFSFLGEGCMPGLGATQRLPRLVGEGRALRLLLTGEEVCGEDALAMGLVSWLAPERDVLTTSMQKLQSVLAVGPVVLAHLLEAVVEGARLPLEDGLALESSLFGIAEASDEARARRGAAAAERGAVAPSPRETDRG